MRLFYFMAFFVSTWFHPGYGQIITQVFDTTMDTTLKKTLESLRVKDQTLREILPIVKGKYGKDSSEMLYIWELIHQQDSINEIMITGILDKYGWIGTTQIGYKGNQTIWLVIQHAPLGIQEKYLPLLKISVNEGESPGWYLAFLHDRIQMRKGEKQTYGTQSTYNNITGETHIYPIEDPAHVNERRKALDLDPIEEYSAKNGYIYNPDEWNK